jgi:Flp pilus assembly protein TadD
VKAALLAGLLVLTAACARRQEPAPGRLIVLRFENLSGNPALDWMSRGAAHQIAFQLEGASVADSVQRQAERERAIAGGAKRILHGYVSQAGGSLRLRAEIEEPGSRKFAHAAESTGPASAGLVPLAGAVVRQLDSAAHPFGAKNDAALDAFIGGLEAPNAAAAADSLSRSIAADPDFGAPYLVLIELDVARKDPAAAGRMLAMARARGEALAPATRARLDVAAAQISGDTAALSRSLAALAHVTPADKNLLRNLGGMELAAKRFPAAIDYYKKALAAQPGDATLLNELGYAQAYAGDLDGAVKTLREYERVSPKEANPLDSLGDVHFYWGRFSEAEKFYRQAYGQDAAFQSGASLFKGARARLMTGDVSGAEAVFAEYETARRAANDPAIGFARARWNYLCGKRKEAMRAVEAFAAGVKGSQAAGVADCMLTVWLIEAGDRAAAAKHNACRFLNEPHAASFPSPVAKALTLLLANDFQAALPVLREVAARAAPNPTEIAPVLLGWALVETGHLDEAEKYLQTIPVPSAPLPAPFESMIIPRIFHLRAVVAEKKGATREAEQNNRLFQTLSAPRN